MSSSSSKLEDAAPQNEIDLDQITVVAANDQVFGDLDGEAVILHLSSGVYYGLNSVGTRVWNLIQSPIAVSEIREALLAEYEVEPEICEKELIALLNELSQRGLIQDCYEGHVLVQCRARAAALVWFGITASLSATFTSHLYRSAFVCAGSNVLLQRAGSDEVKRDVLLIGPLPPPIAGDTRVFSFLVSDLAQVPGFRVRVLNTSRGTEANSMVRNALVLVNVLLRVLLNASRVDVISFHASYRGMVTFGPILYVIARLSRRRLVMRLFGGSFDVYFAARGRLMQRFIKRSVLASDVCLLETRRLVEYFTPISRRVEWFSNYTRLDRAVQLRTTSVAPPRCERFVFAGHMWVTKGIDVILQAIPLLPRAVAIDLYGPLDDYSEADLAARGAGRVHYRGAISNEELMTAMQSYHALVLPTFHSGEGYPGVIVEAFAHGLPVIASRWLSIPEIVDESCGILIEPRSVPAFAAAVTRLHEDEDLYHRLRKGAVAKSAQFSDVYWTRRFANVCADV